MSELIDACRFFRRYADRCDYQLMEMDTDSLYVALAIKLHDMLIPERKREFYGNYSRWFPREACPQHETKFVQAKLAVCVWFRRNVAGELKSTTAELPSIQSGV